MPERHDVTFPLPRFVPDRPEGDFVREPARETPIIAACQVAVLGGGPAGVCAAVAAARQGAEVVLVERYGFLGGMATAADVNLWHSFYGTDHTTRVIGGLPCEIIERLRRREAVYNSEGDSDRGYWVFDSEQAKFIFDDLVVGSGVKLLLHTWLADAYRYYDSVSHAIVETKSGRGAIAADIFIDCTGDADLVRRAGGAVQLGDREGGCQPPSLCFRLAGVAPDHLDFSQVQAELFKTPMDYNGERYPTLLWGSRSVAAPDEYMLAGVRVPGVDVANELDLTRAEVEARYQLRWLLERLRSLPGWEGVRLVDIATQIGGRESYHLKAEHRLSREEILQGRRFPDAIAQGTYPIDIHTPGGPGITFENLDGTTRHIRGDRTVESGRWDGKPLDAPRRQTLCYQIPFGSLVPHKLTNVLAAGRCIGATHDSAGAIRVMVNCMQTGQAAGVAAVVTPPHHNVHMLEVSEVQDKLRGMGVPLPQRDHEETTKC